MTDTDYAESTAPRGRPQMYREEREDLLVKELRVLVGSHVGLNVNPETGFTKGELNSIHAYLTGEYAFPKRDYRTSNSPPMAAVRIKVATRAEISDFTTPEDWDEDSDEAPEIPDHGGERPFNKSEIIDLLEAVEATKDKRPRP